MLQKEKSAKKRGFIWKITEKWLSLRRNIDDKNLYRLYIPTKYSLNRFISII